jgi:hypothetical protein
VFGAATTSAGLQQNWTEQVAETGVSAGMSIANMLGGYAFEQWLDLNWASNWSEADDLYRGSAEWSSGTGSWAGSANGHNLGTQGLQVAGLWEDFLNGAKGYDDVEAKGLGVYVLYDEDGRVAYIGRSKDIHRRAAESARRLGLSTTNAKMIPLQNADAVRALEDLGIRRNKLIENGRNKINGMSRKSMSKVKSRYLELAKMLGKL